MNNDLDRLDRVALQRASSMLAEETENPLTMHTIRGSAPRREWTPQPKPVEAKDEEWFGAEPRDIPELSSILKEHHYRAQGEIQRIKDIHKRKVEVVCRLWETGIHENVPKDELQVYIKNVCRDKMGAQEAYLILAERGDFKSIPMFYVINKDNQNAHELWKGYVYQSNIEKRAKVDGVSIYLSVRQVIKGRGEWVCKIAAQAHGVVVMAGWSDTIELAIERACVSMSERLSTAVMPEMFQ